MPEQVKVRQERNVRRFTRQKPVNTGESEVPWHLTKTERNRRAAGVRDTRNMRDRRAAVKGCGIVEPLCQRHNDDERGRRAAGVRDTKIMRGIEEPL